MANEQKIQKEILDYLKLIGIFAWRNYNGPMIVSSGSKAARVKNPVAGSPDIMGILPCGLALQIEVKEHAKSPRSERQIDWINRAKKCGAVAMFAWSLDQVKKAVGCCPNCPPDFVCGDSTDARRLD
jgi:hypothetical protein